MFDDIIAAKALVAPEIFTALLGLWGAYLLVLLTPGPNLFAVGGLASLRGFRATLPLTMGIAVGATGLAATLMGGALLIGQSATAFYGTWATDVGKLIGGALMLYIGVRIAISVGGCRGSTAMTQNGSARSCAGAEFLAGIFTAFTNPVTAAGLASQIVGRSAPVCTTCWAIPALIGIGVLALTKGLLVARIFSADAARETAQRWQRPVKVVLGMTFALLGGKMLAAAGPHVLNLVA